MLCEPKAEAEPFYFQSQDSNGRLSRVNENQTSRFDNMCEEIEYTYVYENDRRVVENSAG